MTRAEEFRQRAARIIDQFANREDPEQAHGDADKLAVEALQLIIQGHADSHALATAALSAMTAPGERWYA